MGVRKKPSVERGPKATAATRQPQMMTTAGVLQVADDRAEGTFFSLGAAVGAERGTTERVRLSDIKIPGANALRDAKDRVSPRRPQLNLSLFEVSA
jgi:hypothetical protein